MERYIAIDAGKHGTKVAAYTKGNETAKTFMFLTKIGEGDFRDDALEKQTAIIEYNGKTYKVGKGATEVATMDTSKHDEIHKVCALAAIAMCCSTREEDIVHVAIGMPVNEWENVSKRVEFKDFIFPKGKITMKVKLKADSPVTTRTFTIDSTHVYPETQGALFIGDTINTGKTAVIDLGHKNNNCTVWDDFELDHKYSITGNLGGGRLISRIARALSKEFTFCDDSTVEKLLEGPEEERYLHSNKQDEEIKEKSRAIIKEEMLKHVKEIRKECDESEWPIDYMTLFFIGGTSLLLKEQIIEVFGKGIYIPEKPEYANCLGFLRVMCGKLLDVKIGMPEYIDNIVDAA